MRCPLLWLLCTTIVAAFPLDPSAAAVSEDVPLHGGTAGLSHALGIDQVPERGRFMFEITRLVYDTPEGRRPAADAFLEATRQTAPRGKRDAEPDTRPAELVPVPLTAELWSSAIFHRKVAKDELVTAIVADRTAALVCHGLAALDEETLAFFAEHPAVLTRIYERSAPMFAAFSDSLRIRANRVEPPGGAAAVPLWEAVLLEKATRPDRFLFQLLELNDGRLAYLYDVIGQLDPARRAFTLGLWLPSAPDRLGRFKALTLGLNATRDWHVRTLPFGRAAYDLMMMLARIAVDRNGAPLAPASRALWSRVFGGGDLPDDRQARAVEDDPFDAAWLMDTIGSTDVRQRAERLDQLAFGQRVFGDVGAGTERSDMFVAIRALPRFRMLMWTIERIGIRMPALYAAAARHAGRLGLLDGRRSFDALAQFQGALALVARMASVRTLDAAHAQALIARLVALPTNEQGRYAGAVAAWLREDLAAAVRPANTLETTILAAMSGPPSGERSRGAPLTWEGQAYRLDLGAAELRRLQRVREKQEGVSLDVPLEIAAASRPLTGEKLTVDDIAAIVARLTRVAEDVPTRSRRDEEDNVASSAGVTPGVRDALRKLIDDLTRAERNQDVKRAARLAEPLTELADQLLGQVLLSIAYAADVGDPDGTVLLAGDVSRRHDFGSSARDAEARLRTAWAVPRQDVAPGLPWHVTGSLLGLDVGLAPLVLRRLTFERVLEAPKLTSNEREAFAVSVSLLNPFALLDADRDAIAGAVERGRRRVQALAHDGTDLDPLADELALEGWRRRAVRWTLAREPDRVLSLLTLTELLTLGGGRTADLNSWGMAMLTAQGCLCSRLTPPGRWPTLLGRPQLGLTASGMADLNLHVAMMLKELHLPAALAKVVLSGAMQDFIDEVKPTDDADWLTLVQAARSVSRERIEDYVAAATAAGPLVPDSDRLASRVP